MKKFITVNSYVMNRIFHFTDHVHFFFKELMLNGIFLYLRLLEKQDVFKSWEGHTREKDQYNRMGFKWTNCSRVALQLHI